MNNFVKKLILIFIGAFVLAWAGNYPSWWWLSLVGLLPLIYIIYQPNTRPKKIFLWGWFFGAVYLFGIHLFAFSALPLDWAGIESKWAGYLLVLYSNLFTVTVLGFFVGLWAFCFTKFKRGDWTDFLGAPFLWVLFEYLRALAYSIATYGEGGLIGSTWSLGFLGYHIAPSNFLLPLASLGGIWLLSFMVVSINLIIYFIICRIGVIRDYTWVNKKNIIGLALVLAVIPLAFIVQNKISTLETNTQFLKFAVANTYTPSYAQATPEIINTNLENNKKLLLTLSEEFKVAPDVIFMPEDSRFLEYLASTGERDFIRNLFSAQEEILFIDSERVPNQAGSPNLRFTYVNSLTGQYGYSGKSFLLIHGEYVPYVSKFILSLFGQSDWVRGFEGIRSNQRGEYEKGFDHDGLHVEATACSDLFLPFLYSQNVDRGAGFLLNAASHSLIKGSKTFYNQTVNMAKVRAVETNRFFIMAANYTPSFVLDNNGQMINHSNMTDQEDSFIYNDIPIIKKNTFYQIWYRYILGVFLLGTLAFFLSIFLKR